jgi:hypothetical protein
MIVDPVFCDVVELPQPLSVAAVSNPTNTAEADLLTARTDH